ncbi:MAG: Trk system potassium transporter TrkA [Clostridia bacterium]|nr:Trk system potassium transporter TrkA [Clostridia bacterium]
MKVAIVGAGKLGISLVQTLLGGGNEITLIDKDEDLVQRVNSRYDILTLAANAKRVDVLEELKIWTYDLLIAVTDKDERNIVICNFAKELGCARVIARVTSPEHVEQLEFIKKVQKIDHIVNPDMACAQEIYKYLTQKYTLQGGQFAADGFNILEFKIDRMPQLFDKQIKEVSRILDGLLIAAISRSGQIIVPNGNTMLKQGDWLYVIGTKERIESIGKSVKESKLTTDLRKVMIAGGGKTGYFLAKKLSDFNIAVKIIEQDRERCEWLSARLDDVLILHGDATDTNLLREENMDGMDAFVAVTGFDEENLMLSLIAKQQGIEDVVTKMSRNSYNSLTESLGVSMIINPIDMCASSILRFIQKGDKMVVFAEMIQGQAEFIEIWAEKNMPITEGTLMDIEIPEGVLVAAVHRDNDIIIPSGRTRIMPGDKVVFLSLLSSMPDLEGLIKR